MEKNRNIRDVGIKSQKLRQKELPVGFNSPL